MLAVFEKVFAVFFALMTCLTQYITAPMTIKIDFNKVTDEIRPVHNVGRMPEYELNSEINRYFTEANMTMCRTHDINCTDIHNIFPDFSADVNDESSYHFAESDKVMAAIADTGMTPFFRLGISYSNAEKDHALLLPPADYDKWAQICEHIILHYNEGWADGFEYGIEYWEIWNEPDGGKYEEISETEFDTENVFWHGSPEQFYRLYDVAATYLKDKFPGLKIGGYGSCGFYALTKTNHVKSGAPAYNKYFIEFFQGFLDYIKEHKPPMDFFTWHSYSVTDNNARYIKYVKENLAKAGYADAEIICDEWNYNPTENDQIDRRYGANQTSMLCMFQNEGLDAAYYYCGIATGALHAGMFLKSGVPSTAYYGFWAFGQLYKLGSQVEVSGYSPEDLYTVAAKGENGAAMLIANVSEKKDRKLRIDAGDRVVDKCMTVNENGEWTQIPLPEKIEGGSMLYITFLDRGETPKKYFTLSFDDGVTQDRKIMDICRKYGFTGITFNINTGLCGANWEWVGDAIGVPGTSHQRFTKDELKNGVYDGFDVAVHTLDHPSMKLYDNDIPKLRQEINADARNIYMYTGTYPLGMAWPGGDTEYTDKTVELVAKYTDMGFARAVTPTHDFRLPEYFLKWQPTCSIIEEDVLKYAEDFLNAECTEDMLFYVWGHGYELDAFDKYDTLETLIRRMTEAEDVVCVSNSQFCRLFKDEIPKWKNTSDRIC